MRFGWQKYREAYDFVSIRGESTQEVSDSWARTIFLHGQSLETLIRAARFPVKEKKKSPINETKLSDKGGRSLTREA